MIFRNLLDIFIQNVQNEKKNIAYKIFIYTGILFKFLVLIVSTVMVVQFIIENRNSKSIFC